MRKVSNQSQQRSDGFTLVEIMIAVTVIAILLAMVVPAFQKIRQSTQATIIARTFKEYGRAFDTACFEFGDWPDDADAGAIPEGMDGYVNNFTEETAVGGNWDWDFLVGDIIAAISLNGATVSSTVFEKVDTILDDGDLKTGRFILSGEKYAYQLEW